MIATIGEGDCGTLRTHGALELVGQLGDDAIDGQRACEGEPRLRQDILRLPLGRLRGGTSGHGRGE